MKKVLLMSFFVGISLMSFSQQDVYWRYNASTSNWWDGSNPWYRTCDGWWLARADYNICENNSNIGGNYVHFDNNNQTTMTINGAWFKIFTLTFESAATTGRTLTADGSGGLSFSATNSYLTNLSSATHVFNTGMGVDGASLTINASSGAFTFNNPIYINANSLIFTGGFNNSVNGAISGNGSVTKLGAGTLLFSNSNIYTGPTTITSGTLELSADLSSSLVTVNNGGKLSITGTNVTINSLTIESGGVVEVQAGKSLTVSGTLTNNATEGIVLKSPADNGAPGSLITNGSVSGSGTLKAERYIAAYTLPANGWHLISSPVNTPAITTATNLAPGSTDDLYAWDEVNELWDNYKAGGFTTLTNGKGYLVAYQAASTKFMTGTPNSAAFNLTNLTVTSGNGEGWHLLGNPFQSAIIWNNGSYAITGIGGVAKIMSNTGSYSDINANGVIPAMQGFFVQASNTTNSITFPLNARTHNTASWNKSAENNSILLAANDLDNEMVQESRIIINDQATESYDQEFDSHFLPLYAPQFYSLAGEDLLSTNSIPSLASEELIPFGFVKNNATNFSIELKASIEGYNVYLTDLKTNSDQNLTEIPVYAFTSDASDEPNRFVLHFMSTVGLDKPTAQSAIHIYSNNGKIFVTGAKDNSGLMVRNMVGQVVLKRDVSGENLQTINAGNLTPGIYVVSLISGSQVVSEKVVIGD
jgi:autotransporter-associated beta strand protein